MTEQSLINFSLLGKTIKNAATIVINNLTEPVERPEDLPLYPGDRVEIKGKSGQWTYLSDEMAFQYHPRRSANATFDGFMQWRSRHHKNKLCCMSDNGEWAWVDRLETYSQGTQINLYYQENGEMVIIPRCAIEGVIKLKQPSERWNILLFTGEILVIRPDQIIEEASEDLLKELNKEGMIRGFARVFSQKRIPLPCD